MNASREPLPGQIVEHHFLWAREAALGQVEARKARPCIVVAVEHLSKDETFVTLLAVTTQKPQAGSIAVKVPHTLHARLGLDDAHNCWVVIDDVNEFTWPGFDLVPQPDGGFARGFVSSGFFAQLSRTLLGAQLRGNLRRVNRDED